MLKARSLYHRFNENEYEFHKQTNELNIFSCNKSCINHYYKNPSLLLQTHFFPWQYGIRER